MDCGKEIYSTFLKFDEEIPDVVLHPGTPSFLFTTYSLNSPFSCY